MCIDFFSLSPLSSTNTSLSLLSGTNETKNAMQTLLFESDVKISLESSGGQVISVTKNGLVIAPRARNLGPNELLILKECEDGWAFQTSQNKLLGLGNSSDILEEKIDVEEEEAEQKDEEPTSHVIATKASPVTSKETWSVVREGQYILLRGQNEQYVTIGSVGGVISCDAVNRAQATKFRVLLRTTEFEDFKTYVRARVPLKRAGSVFLCDLKSVCCCSVRTISCSVICITHSQHSSLEPSNEPHRNTHTTQTQGTCKFEHTNVRDWR